jgi:hypothetical protein
VRDEGSTGRRRIRGGRLVAQDYDKTEEAGRKAGERIAEHQAKLDRERAEQENDDEAPNG